MSVKNFSKQNISPRAFAGGGVKTEVTPYVRPADWPALPVLVEGDQRFVGLHAVYENDGNFCALSAAGHYTVDWGDGVVENYAADVVAYHTYDFYNTNLSAVTERGYKCAIVSLTMQPGQTLTNLNLHQKHNMPGLQIYSSGFLDIAIAGQWLNSLLIGVQVAGVSTQVIIFADLEQVCLLGNNQITNMSYMFGQCYSLQSVPLFNTAACTNMSYMFYQCYSLQSVPLFNTAACTNMSYMFYQCYSLQSVPLFNTSTSTNMSFMFFSCTQLANIDATGFKVSFSVASCKLSSEALNKIYTSLATVSGQTITVTGNYGVSGDDPSIATAKGWTVAG